jgi:hypothetical protein
MKENFGFLTAQNKQTVSSSSSWKIETDSDSQIIIGSNQNPFISSFNPNKNIGSPLDWRIEWSTAESPFTLIIRAFFQKISFQMRHHLILE